MNDGQRYFSTIHSVGPSDDGASMLFRGTFIHWTAREKMPWLKHGKRDEWLECEERLVVCATGPGA